MNNPRLIDIANLDQLNAIRYDLDGDGVPTATGLTAYNTAFGTNIAMGDTNDGSATIPNSPPTFTGYELTADLDFNTTASYASGTVNTAWTSPGTGWVPIGDNSNQFTATFEGNRSHDL